MPPETPPNSPQDRAQGDFVTTLWTTVLRAGSSETTRSREALERLCRRYWFPLYAHARRRGCSPHDAQDAVQGFFADLIGRSPFQALSPERGRFRSFLLVSMDRFLAGERDRQQAAKRGGGREVFSLDETSAEERLAQQASTASSPEAEFDRNWARSILQQALEALAREQHEAGKGAVFARLQPFLTDVTGKADYNEVARELGQQPNTIAVTVKRLRQRYRELVRAEIADTCGTTGEVEAEMQHLLAVMRG